MMCKKDTKFKSHWFVSVVSILMLLAVVCVGSAAAVTEYSVPDGDNLLTALNKLANDDVTINLNGNVDDFNAKEVAVKLITTFINSASNSRTLTVVLGGYHISLTRGDYYANLSGFGTAELSVDAGTHVTTLTLPDNVKLSGKFKYSGETIELKEFTGATITLEPLNEDGMCSISVSGSNEGELKVNDAEFPISNLYIENQRMILGASAPPSPLSVSVSSIPSTPVTGTVEISGAKVTVSSDDFRFDATYNSDISIDADITGTATLMDNQSISKVISVPSFVKGTLELNGYKLGIPSGMILSVNSHPITLNGPGEFTNNLVDNKVNINLTRFYWDPEKTVLKAGSKPTIIAKTSVDNATSGKTTITSIAPSEVTVEAVANDKAVITDTSRRVTITITTSSDGHVEEVTNGVNIFDNSVQSIEVAYPQIKAGENNNGIVTQDVVGFTITTSASGIPVANVLAAVPEISSFYDTEIANTLLQEGVTPKTMISGVDSSANFKIVKIAFELAHPGANNMYVTYHVDNQQNLKLVESTYSSGKLTVKSTEGLSSYVVGIKAIPPSPSSDGSSRNYGASVWLTESPTYEPTATPTETYGPTVIPTGIPTEQPPQSPMPFFGILAGLGAAALAGVVLRRK